MGPGGCLTGEVTLRGCLSNGEERSQPRVAVRRQLWAEEQHARAKAPRQVAFQEQEAAQCVWGRRVRGGEGGSQSLFFRPCR